ncbi:hypothetical protein [Flavobacterium sp. 25HG05S-40]|uniref:hypothetical protein n=1 Tax=Flavobacterium sp. 25HG05S-40 TaxID=3458682 RepID=UPI004043B7C7
MIYKTLRTLPKVTQIEIIETGNIRLLCSNEEEIDINELALIWEQLQADFNEKYNKQQHSKVFNVYKEIEYLDKKYTIIKCAVDSLEFNVDNDLIELLQSYGYRLTLENYNEDLKRIDRESEAITIKINKFKEKLPKQSEQTESSGFSIIENMGAFISILGFDFDFYTVSVEKYHDALEKQVKNKIAAIEKQNAKNKK